MTWLWIVTITWLLLAAVGALVIGRGIKIADGRRSLGASASAVAVPTHLGAERPLALQSGGLRAD